MIFNWDEGTLSPIVGYIEWEGAYFLYVPPTPDDPVVVDMPMASFFGMSDQAQPIIVNMPRVTYDTTGNYTSTDTTRIASARDIVAHDGSLFAYHDGSHIAFHAYAYPEIVKTFNVPRTIYSGNVE